MVQAITESTPFHERQHAQNKFRSTYTDSQYHHFRVASDKGKANEKRELFNHIKAFSSQKVWALQIKAVHICITRTRQATPRCSNVRVVLFSHNE